MGDIQIHIQNRLLPFICKAKCVCLIDTCIYPKLLDQKNNKLNKLPLLLVVNTLETPGRAEKHPAWSIRPLPSPSCEQHTPQKFLLSPSHKKWEKWNQEWNMGNANTSVHVWSWLKLCYLGHIQCIPLGLQYRPRSRHTVTELFQVFQTALKWT